MNIQIDQLHIICATSQEVVEFGNFTYFYGKMGAGKSTIARLVDYCLGGDLALTPALQAEFVSALLVVTLGKVKVEIERQRGAEQVTATWPTGPDVMRVLVPVERNAGEVVQGSGVCVLSDLVFWLAGATPPRVRRSKQREDSDLIRLSLRNFLWYSYLDQDTIDSEFFHLGRDANHFKRLPSRDVLRFLLGFHQERVSELELELEQSRTDREGTEASARVLLQVLAKLQVPEEMQLRSRQTEVAAAIHEMERLLQDQRSSVRANQEHPIDLKRQEQRTIASKLREIEQAMAELAEVTEGHRRHLNELKLLATKASRTSAARAVLQHVRFSTCPSCEGQLPERPAEMCHLCGNVHGAIDSPSTANIVERDVQSRIVELEAIIAGRNSSLVDLEQERNRLVATKRATDLELNEIERSYDSAFLGEIIRLEKRKTELRIESDQLDQHLLMRETIEQQREVVDKIKRREADLRDELRETRKQAEKDTTNLTRLGDLFLDCLIRSRIPGFSESDAVDLAPPSFLPEVVSEPQRGVTVTSFATLGSGGKKTLFKCCFALAVHRLAASTGALLPSLLIIDSPMKNISERENKEQFEGFHHLVYELAQTELSGTQFIMIDKEYFAPPIGAAIDVLVRHMSPDNDPLLHAYSGH